MMPKLDRRIQRSRQALQAALSALILEKGYESVTVQDVIDRANVGRATFYAHFRDKEDLLLSEFEPLTAHFQHYMEVSGSLDLWQLCLLMFQHAQDYHSTYKAMVGKQSGEIVQSYLRQYLTGLVGRCLQAQWSPQGASAVPLEVLIYQLVSSLLSLLVWWLDKNLPYSAQQMAQMYQQLTQPGIEAILAVRK